jgi:hypothetical protein
MWVVEDLAVNSLEVISSTNALQVVRQLPEGQLRTLVAVHEPPGSSTNGSGTDISTNSHVTGRKIFASERRDFVGEITRALPEEQPSGDKTFIGFTWWLSHDVEIRWVETESSSGETVSDLDKESKVSRTFDNRVDDNSPS